MVSLRGDHAPGIALGLRPAAQILIGDAPRKSAPIQRFSEQVRDGRKELVCATTREENKHPPEGSVGVRAERDLDLLVPEALTMLQLPL